MIRQKLSVMLRSIIQSFFPDPVFCDDICAKIYVQYPIGSSELYGFSDVLCRNGIFAVHVVYHRVFSYSGLAIMRQIGLSEFI